MGKCKGCGREIIWIMTRSGKAMPCDPKVVYYSLARGFDDTVVLKNGHVITKCSIENNPERADGIGYVPHWSTCPVAGQFKRRG